MMKTTKGDLVLFDIRFSLANRPGTTAVAARAVADRGINLLGICGDIRPGEQWGFIHFLVEDVEGAKDALEQSGYEVLDIHQVDLFPVDDEPGVLARMLDEYSSRGENIEVLYTGVDTQLVIGTENNRRSFKGRRTSETSYADTRTKVDPASD